MYACGHRQKVKRQKKTESGEDGKMLDMIVIGSGPAGITAGIYAKRAGLRVCVLERDYMGSGQIAQSGRVDNYPGMAGMSGYEMGSRFLEDARQLGVPVTEGRVTEVTKDRDFFTVALENGELMRAKTVIYCAGASPRTLGLPGEKEFAGCGVSYCATCDGAFFKDMDTAVVGGGNTALDDALYLSGVCRSVYLIHRREEFRGAAATLAQLKQRKNVELITRAQVTAIRGNGMVEELELDNGRTLAVSGVFVAVGRQPETELIAGYVTRDTAGYVVAGEDCITETEGLYVAGDLRRKKLRQVVTATADGANAVCSALEYLQQKEKK